ncbi:MAG: Gfo/Idh/MocA family oxidoreductase [Bryobacterales bacterium]
MKVIRIAMLGSGFVADFYMQGLANVNGQEVVVNYSRSAERGEAFKAKWGVPECSTDLAAVASRDDIDLFVIALPNEEHLPTALLLAEKGRNQVCTKPLARNRAEARAIWDAAKSSGAMHGYAETEVFAPAVVKAREVVEGGGIGRVLWVRSRESHSGPHSPHFWDVEKPVAGR